MDTNAAGVAEALDLIDHGVPVFTAKPSRGSDGPEYFFPKSWTSLPADPELIKDLGPGMALLAATGHGLDVIDIDPKNSADVHEQVAAVLRYGIPILGHVVTPSMGAHLYIPGTGLHNAAIVGSGVDFRGEGGMVFLPGTERSKYHGGGYVWLNPINWEDLEVWRPHAKEVRARVENYLTHLGWDPMGVRRSKESIDEIDAVYVGCVPGRLYDNLMDTEGPWQMGDGSFSTDRSSRFQSLVSSCFYHGFTFAQTVTLLQPWCLATDKFVGRVTSETLRSWRVCQDNPLD